VSLDQLGARAAAAAHRAAATADVERALARVLVRHRRRQVVQRRAMVLAAAVLAVVALVVVPRLGFDENRTAPVGTPYRPELVPSVQLTVPEGFRVIREDTWHLDIAPAEGVGPDQPWAEFNLLVPDGVYDQAAEEVRPLPDDLESWVLNVPDVEILGQRRVTVDGRDAFQYDDHPTYLSDRPYFAVGEEALPGGTAIYQFRTTLVEVDGRLVVVGGTVQQKFWPLPEPGTPGDDYDALLESIRFD
jgi:hypothetical protein